MANLKPVDAATERGVLIDFAAVTGQRVPRGVVVPLPEVPEEDRVPVWVVQALEEMTSPALRRIAAHIAVRLATRADGEAIETAGAFQRIVERIVSTEPRPAA